MSAPVRFLAVVVIAWAGVRAGTVGTFPGLTVSHAKTAPASIVPTEFPPLPPVAAYGDQSWAAQAPAQPPQPQFVPVPVRIPVGYLPGAAQVSGYYPASVPAVAPIPPRAAWSLAASTAAPEFYAPIKPIGEWPLGEFVRGPRSSSPVPQAAILPGSGTLDRLQLSTWALLRGTPTASSLASGGTLGGSQGGARLTYAFNRWAAASLRTSTPLGGSRGTEVAGGIRFTPIPSIPLAITAERRQSVSRFGGRSGFALFAETGLYRQPMPLDFELDAYLQAGVVGVRERMLFADGAFTFTRPVYGRFSAGLGVWGGIQPDLYRVDAGPRVSMRVRDNIRLHADWRQRIVGAAQPDSGPALTIAADF